MDLYPFDFDAVDGVPQTAALDQAISRFAGRNT
ncbi:hypothetical protein ABIB54_001794 [Frigoribacterium sp. UYMn621]